MLRVKPVSNVRCRPNPWAAGGRTGVGQAKKSVRWMLWESMPRKDVASDDTHRGAARRR